MEESAILPCAGAHDKSAARHARQGADWVTMRTDCPHHGKQRETSDKKN